MSSDIETALNALADIRLPEGVTMNMVAAGMKEWDAQMKAGQRHWPNVLGAVYAAMSDAAPKQRNP